jgi:hypothetical protein
MPKEPRQPCTIERESLAKSRPLVDAALRIGRSYNATMRLILLRQLDGGRNDHGQWFVTEKSIKEFLEAQSTPNTAA